MNINTKLVHGSDVPNSTTGSISIPIYQNATFKHPGINQSTGYDYSRTLNPTREKLEKTYSILESAHSAFAFSTGMAAISAIMEIFSCGDHFIVCDDIYGGTYRLFEDYSKKRNMSFSFIDTTSLQTVRATIQKNTKAIFYETPTNPMMKISDIQGISDICKSHGLLSIVDNTFLTPYFQRPIELGADLVISSATKYLGGHNDTLGGLVAVANVELAEQIKFIQNNSGAVLSPFDSWLIIRGIKTLSVRMDRQEQNAGKIAQWLTEQANITKVYYPGLPTHQGHDINKLQSGGFGSMISFEVKEKLLVEKILSKVKVISFAESLGGVESLITYPIVQTHCPIPQAILDKLGVNDRLMRMSVGIESLEDLIKDLNQAINES
jgi:cystathionine gamma-synthase